jgi:hypothetical protein
MYDTLQPFFLFLNATKPEDCSLHDVQSPSLLRGISAAISRSLWEDSRQYWSWRQYVCFTYGTPGNTFRNLESTLLFYLRPDEITPNAYAISRAYIPAGQLPKPEGTKTRPRSQRLSAVSTSRQVCHILSYTSGFTYVLNKRTWNFLQEIY